MPYKVTKLISVEHSPLSSGDPEANWWKATIELEGKPDATIEWYVQGAESHVKENLRKRLTKLNGRTGGKVEWGKFKT